MPFPTVSGHSKANEDLKQQNSELEEKLRVLVTENSTMQMRFEESQKKLEMSELLLQQVRGWSPRDYRAVRVVSLGIIMRGPQRGARKFGSLFCSCHIIL